MPVRTRQLLAEVAPGVGTGGIDVVDADKAVGEPKGGLEGIGQSSENIVGGDETINDHRNVVFILLLQRRRLTELNLLAVHDCARISTRGKFLEEIDELTLLL